MKYLYGDATESPIRLNYIELLRNVLEFSVSMLLSDDMVHKYTRRGERREGAATAELRQLRQVADRVGKTLDAMVRKKPLPKTGKCLDGIRGAALAEIKRAESGIRQELEAELGKIRAAIGKERSDNNVRLQKLLAAHDLPDSDTSVDLSCDGERYHAQLVGRAPCQVDWRMNLAVPDGHSLAEMLRLDSLFPLIAIKVPEEAGWISKTIKLKSYKLTRDYLTSVKHRAGTMLVELRGAPAGSDSGYDLSYDRGGAPRSVRRYHKGVAGQPFQPEQEDVEVLRELGAAVRSALDALRAHPGSLVDAQLDGKPFSDHDDPCVLVERLITQIAPVIQEISDHSLSPTELVLKRVLADDRREEIFASKKDLLDKLAPLPGRLRGVFRPLGLGDLGPDVDEDISEGSSIAPPVAEVDLELSSEAISEPGLSSPPAASHSSPPSAAASSPSPAASSPAASSPLGGDASAPPAPGGVVNTTGPPPPSLPATKPPLRKKTLPKSKGPPIRSPSSAAPAQELPPSSGPYSPMFPSAGEPVLPPARLPPKRSSSGPPTSSAKAEDGDAAPASGPAAMFAPAPEIHDVPRLTQPMFPGADPPPRAPESSPDALEASSDGPISVGSMPGRVDTLPGVPSPFAPAPSVAPLPKPSRPPQRRIRRKKPSKADSIDRAIDDGDSVEIQIDEFEE